MNQRDLLALGSTVGMQGNIDEIPLARDFTHSSPFGVVKGREKYLEWVKPLAARDVTSLKIVKTSGGKSESAIWLEMMTPGGLVQVCYWVETYNEEIVAVTSFYDATQLRTYQQAVE